MVQFIVRRLILAILSFFIAMAIVFFAIRLVPGDQLTTLTGERVVGEADRAALKRQLGLDAPLHEQFVTFVWDLVRGDLGHGTFDKEPVIKKVQKRMGVTVELALLAAVTASAIAIPFGVISAVTRNSPLDYGVRFLGILALCVPSFWLATLVLVYSSIWFAWVPTSQRTSLLHDPAANLEQFIIPSLILGAVLAGGLMRITRSQMLEVLREDYIRTARSKGLRGRTVIIRHAVRNALIPVVTVIGLQITGLLSGTVIVESIFGLQGLGTLIMTALEQRDYPVIQGVNVIAVMIVIVVNLAVDLSYAVIDPRLRHLGR